jgi:hypothetical protein
MLARRLARHGLTLPAGALTAALSPSTASACVPAPLVKATVDAGLAVTGQGGMGTVSANVVALTEGVLKAMWVKSQKLVATVLLAVGVLLGAAAIMVLADRTAQDARAKILPLEARGRRVVWSPDRKTLLVVTKVEKTFLGIQYDRRGSAIRLWDVEKGRMRQTVAEDPEKGLAFGHVVFSRDGTTIAATTSEEIQKPNMRMIRAVVKVWDAKTLDLKQKLTDDDSHLACLALSRDGKQVLGGDPNKKKILLWDTGTGKVERTLNAGKIGPWFLAFSPDGKTLIVGGIAADHSGEVQLWDTQTWKLRHAWKQEKYVPIVAFSPDGKLIAGNSGDELIRIWNVEKGDLIASLKGDPRYQRSVAFSADCKMVAAGGPDGNIRLWNVQTGELKETLKGHSAEVYSVAFSPDGKILASTGQDQTLRLWKMQK